LHKARNLLPLLSVFVLVFASFNIALCEPTDSSIASKAASYLIASYNSTLHLCPEVYGHSELGRIYWICSDNLLAYYALQNYSEPISGEIKAEIKEYAANYGLPTNSEGLPLSYKHESVIGEVLPPYFRNASNCYLVNASDYTIKTEINNGTLMDDWENYADLLAFRGLSLVREGRIDEANSSYNKMMKMWDNYGFADAVHNDTYATYKLALAIILRRALNLTQPSEENQMVEIIKTCQKSDGGVITDYTKELEPVGLANTETTALVIIAETEPPIPPIPENVNNFLLEIVVSVTAIVIIAKAAKTMITRFKMKF
jgi:tetratricopeptide (TPR) repeat protein